MAYKFQVGEARLGGNLVQEGTLSGSSTLGALALTGVSLDVQSGGISNAGAIAGATNVDGTGDLTMGTITMTGFTVDADGDTNLKTLAVDDGSTIGCDSDGDLLTLAANILTVAGEVQMTTLDIGGTNVTATATELNYLDIASLGTAAASKALVADGSAEIDAGALTFTDLGAVTTVDINGGSIDGAVIGAASAAAGSFTTVAASSTATIEGVVSGAAGTFDALSGTSLALQSGGITAAGAIAGATTVAMAGALTGVTTIAASSTATIEGVVSGAAGTFDALSGTTVTAAAQVSAGTHVSASVNLKADGLVIGASKVITGTKAIQNITTINASSTITGGTLSDGTFSVNAGGLTGVASIAATGDIDIGAHNFRAETLQSDIATGTAPFTVASATNVPNLNASSLDGATFAAPGSIGSGTPGAGTFVALTATSGDFSDGNIANVGDIDCDSISVADAANGLTIDFSGGNDLKNEIKLKDNVGNALAITQGANVYMQFVTTDSSEVVKMQKMVRLADDTKLEFGTNSDASFEYDEDGTDRLLYAGAGLRISDDTKLEFGSGGDVTMEYDEDGTDELRFAGNAVTFEQAVSFDGDMALGLTTADTITVKGNSTFAGTTVASLGTVTTADIDGGTLDGVTIGGASAAAGTFTSVVGTTISGSGNLSTKANLSVNGTTTLYGEVTVRGDLIVSGSKIIHSTSHLLVNDPLIGLGYSEQATGSAGDRGILMGLAGENAPTMFWDESGSEFAFATTTSLPTDSAVAVAAYADLQVKDLTVNSIAGSVLQTINSIGDEAGTLTAGFNRASANLTAARAWTLPASPTVGQIVYVKAAGNCSDTLTVTITRAGAQLIDGATTAVLQSPNAAVGLCFVAANTWSIF